MSAQILEYGPETRYGNYKFGRGGFRTSSLQIEPIKDRREIALKLGWSQGCVIARELTSPGSPYDLEWMINRYAETNSWYSTAVFQARGNKAVHDWLSSPRLRLATEPVGKHEPLSVPRSHLWKISPMSGVDGYATPRVAIEIKNKIGGNEGSNTAYDVLWDVSKKVGNEPGKYLTMLSEAAVQQGVDPVTLLEHVFPAGILQEQNSKVAFWDLAVTLNQHAPTVWRAYLDLPQSQRDGLALASVPKLQ